MDILYELKDFYKKMIQYKELVETPFYTNAIKTNIQNLRTELQRSYSRLDGKITQYSGENLTIVEPFFGKKSNIFGIAFDSIGFLNYPDILNAINKALKIVNIAIGKLEAEQDKKSQVIDWGKGYIDKDFMEKMERVFKPFEGKRETSKKEPIEHGKEKTQKSAILFDLRRKYLMLRSSVRPQNRGYELEKLLYELLRLFELSPNKPFKITGEQIDGSFTLEGMDFLIEAQWEKVKPAAEELYGFQGKVNRKLQGTKGLFISIEGFTPTSMQAFEKGTTPNILLMDGEDLLYVLEERIDLVKLLSEKRKHASRTGEIFYKARFILGETF
jgi:hypothetical protein